MRFLLRNQFSFLYENSNVTELSNPLNVRRRLKRQWPSDLKDQREEEEEEEQRHAQHNAQYI
jgi:hypothetical protein